MDRLNLFGKILVYFILTGCALLFILPLIWMISTSLKPLDQTMNMPPKWLPLQYSGVIENKKQPVQIVQKIYEPSVAVKIKESGRVSIIPESDYKGGFWVTVNQANKKIIKQPVELIKKIPASQNEIWVKIIPEVDSLRMTSGNSESVWTITTAKEISSRVCFRWKNFIYAVEAMRYFGKYLLNTLVLCFLTCLGTVLSSSFIAYGFAKIDWRGKNIMFMILLSTMMIPFAVTMAPVYCMFRNIGMIGTLQPLWVGAFFGSAFNIFLLRQFFLTIPAELSDAARIDGCSEFKIYSRIILPMSKPALLVVGLFQFMYTWNDFMGPLIYLTDQKHYTLALGLQFYQSQQGGTTWNYLMAASTLMIIPVIILFLFCQKSFIQGISTTGFKG